MKNSGRIHISYYKTKIGELILGSFNGKLCLLDYRNRNNRSTIDKRIMRFLKADFVEMEDDIIRQTKQQIDEYLAGERNQFDLPILTVGTKFQKQVWQELLNIDYGETISYLDLATRINKSKAVRAVASAVGANAISLVIPCHRIIQTSGGLGGYAGGLTAKKKLLEIEGHNNDK